MSLTQLRNVNKIVRLHFPPAPPLLSASTATDDKITDHLYTDIRSHTLDNATPATELGFPGEKRTIVVGAGVAGLTFVVSLQKIWLEKYGRRPDVTVYERDYGQSDLSREGFSISINSHESSGGIHALQRMNLLDAILGVGITRKGNKKGWLGLWSVDWRRLATVRDKGMEGPPPLRLRVARTKLRRVLIDAAMEHRDIVWGATCTGVARAEDGRLRVTFSNGRTELCDLLVVADGANSKLRALLRPEDKLNFAGPVSISAVSRFSGPPPEPVSRDWGIVTSGEGVALFAAPMDRSSANWSLSYMAEKPRAEERQPLPPASNEQLMQEVRRRGAVFNEPFRTLIANTDQSTLMVFNAMDKKPFGHGAANGLPDDIVFIGDSNHAVSPFAGDGANLALRDGYDLAECLSDHHSMQAAMAAYDKRSMARASKSVRESHFSIAVAHSKGLAWVVCHASLLLYGALVFLWDSCLDVFASASGVTRLRLGNNVIAPHVQYSKERSLSDLRT